MAEDLLDYWVRLIKIIFPENAWITSRFVKDDCLIQIDWKLKNNPKNPNKRSPKIEIIIKENVIKDYLNKNKNDRELSDVILKELIRERYHHFISDNAPITKWLVSRDALNCKPHLASSLHQN